MQLKYKTLCAQKVYKVGMEIDGTRRENNERAQKGEKERKP